MSTLTCWSHSASRFRNSFPNLILIFLTTFSLFLFYINSYVVDTGTNELKIIWNPSAEDLQYNLLGIDSFNHIAIDKCARHRPVYSAVYKAVNLKQHVYKPIGACLTLHIRMELFIADESLNDERLQQDHPCVIETIRRHYLRYPSPPDIPLQLDHPQVVDQSAVQSKVILPLLQNKTKGFYIECGAADGEMGSNTLYMERYLDWDGILIEANHKYYNQLLSRKRKAYVLHVCLSLQPYPTTVYFHEDNVAGKIKEGLDSSLTLDKIVNPVKGNLVRLQCFPLYSILLAVGRTRIDYFSVDVEGSETKILKTVPWHRVDIKTLTVEVTSRNMSVVEALVHYMAVQGYKKVDLLDGSSYFDLVFVKE